MDEGQVRRAENVLLQFRARHQAVEPPNREEVNNMMDPELRVILSPDQYQHWRANYIDGQNVPSNREPSKPPLIAPN
jgi:hypothetical protein